MCIYIYIIQNIKTISTVVSYIRDRIVWRVNELIILLYVQRRSVGKKVFDSLETSGFACPTEK